MDNYNYSLVLENHTLLLVVFNITTTLSPQLLLETKLGPQRKNVIYVIILLLVYGLIFISGIVGNVCTCFVILKNNSLRATTNYYLLSLAVSDVFILLLGEYCFYLFGFIFLQMLRQIIHSWKQLALQ